MRASLILFCDEKLAINGLTNELRELYKDANHVIVLDVLSEFDLSSLNEKEKGNEYNRAYASLEKIKNEITKRVYSSIRQLTSIELEVDSPEVYIFIISTTFDPYGSVFIPFTLKLFDDLNRKELSQVPYLVNYFLLNHELYEDSIINEKLKARTYAIMQEIEYVRREIDEFKSTFDPLFWLITGFNFESRSINIENARNLIVELINDVVAGHYSKKALVVDEDFGKKEKLNTRVLYKSFGGIFYSFSLEEAIDYLNKQFIKRLYDKYRVRNELEPARAIIYKLVDEFYTRNNLAHVSLEFTEGKEKYAPSFTINNFANLTADDILSELELQSSKYEEQEFKEAYKSIVQKRTKFLERIKAELLKTLEQVIRENGYEHGIKFLEALSKNPKKVEINGDYVPFERDITSFYKNSLDFFRNLKPKNDANNIETEIFKVNSEYEKLKEEIKSLENELDLLSANDSDSDVSEEEIKEGESQEKNEENETTEEEMPEGREKDSKEEDATSEKTQLKERLEELERKKLEIEDEINRLEELKSKAEIAETSREQRKNLIDIHLKELVKQKKEIADKIRQVYGELLELKQRIDNFQPKKFPIIPVLVLILLGLALGIFAYFQHFSFYEILGFELVLFFLILLFLILRHKNEDLEKLKEAQKEKEKRLNELTKLYINKLSEYYDFQLDAFIHGNLIDAIQETKEFIHDIRGKCETFNKEFSNRIQDLDQKINDEVDEGVVKIRLSTTVVIEKYLSSIRSEFESVVDKYCKENDFAVLVYKYLNGKSLASIEEDVKKYAHENLFKRIEALSVEEIFSKRLYPDSLLRRDLAVASPVINVDPEIYGSLNPIYYLFTIQEKSNSAFYELFANIKGGDPEVIKIENKNMIKLFSFVHNVAPEEISFLKNAQDCYLEFEGDVNSFKMKYFPVLTIKSIHSYDIKKYWEVIIQAISLGIIKRNGVFTYNGKSFGKERDLLDYFNNHPAEIEKIKNEIEKVIDSNNQENILKKIRNFKSKYSLDRREIKYITDLENTLKGI